MAYDSAHGFSCDCGQTEWQVSKTAKGSQVVCYCTDCQAHLRHLDRVDLLHDGGTYIYQTTPDAVTLIKGHENLALQRLGPNGMMRYYTSCCKTPVANTLSKATLPFVGLPLKGEDPRLGPVICHAHTDKGTSGRKQTGFAAAGWGILIRAARAILSGRRASPFFTDAGEPVIHPTVLTREERRIASLRR
ncbi:MAG: DUF6151 family protein [Pelagimonas sp.]|jgi:hypothetical protein|nr:DUF6151 family protein [Pelagimonas sp.]